MQMTKTLTLIKRVSLRLMLALLALSSFLIILLSVSFLYENDAVFTPLMPVLVGAIGGFVGLQRRLKHLSSDDLELLASSWICISLAPLVGGILALLLYVI